ncbi:coiled-coil domain-containing protein 86 [Apodemus sylvaticus]|uniref:coiled-coil domain-containing protein 86 n=1 Tax=Apodemus sylvaticus TaxID=10129 RepID=UPI002241D266|nr:coiled-coil domain-containing protein 86 [Apodemus sylvaticus]
MDTPLRRSRRLEGLKPLSLENLSDRKVPRAKRALVDFQTNPEETGELEPPSVPPLGLASPLREPETSPGSPCPRQEAASPPRQPETSPGSPCPRQDAASPPRQPETSPGSPCPRQDAYFESSPRQPEPPSGALQLHQDLDLESTARQTASSPESPQQEQPSKLSPTQGELDSEAAHAEDEVIPRSPEPCPGQQAPGPEPSQPTQELTIQAPSSPKRQLEPSKLPPAGQTVTESLDQKKRVITSPQAPASKKLKEKEELPVIPKGKPKSGRVWKDRSKKRFSQMVQDKPLRTSWQRKMKERQERKQAKDFARHLEEEKQRRRQEKKERRAENLRRRLENERKAEIVQVIRNPAKLKKAKKKQLRSIEKRDTLALLQKQPPQRPVAKV